MAPSEANIQAETRGNRLRDLREQVPLSRSEMADRIGMGPGSIARIERGDLEGVRLRTLRAFIEIVDADLSVSLVLGDERIRIG